MFNDFFNLPPYDKQFNVRQKKGSITSLSKTLLISRLIHFTKLKSKKSKKSKSSPNDTTSKRDKFASDEFTLKGYIKQYKDKKIDTINSIYF